MQLFKCLQNAKNTLRIFSALSAKANGKRRFFNFLIFARSWELAVRRGRRMVHVRQWGLCCSALLHVDTLALLLSTTSGSVEFVGNISLSSASSPPTLASSSAPTTSTMLTIGMRPLCFFSPLCSPFCTTLPPARCYCCRWQWAKFIHLENLLIFFAGGADTKLLLPDLRSLSGRWGIWRSGGLAGVGI